MKVEYIRRKLKEIKNLQGDPEYQHGAEDGLMHDVLKAIANGAKNSKELAKEVLKSKEIEFPRWYA